ncbi:hypothetical protein [Mycolicibacter virginiensis]|uniref:hypothetical protein n=1 Tax=Mycolicibacter virginiensis TaxID=1795032 RepID=UPI0010573F65|nr:hypothetical protein [Mycolicibacter virginiensis]ULP48655.1 hypothetical protein MJO54_06000 [Mycolicibacter virginiensis]
MEATLAKKRTGIREASRVQCIFCRAKPPLTREHIFGDWLRGLGYSGEGIHEIQRDDGSQPIIQYAGVFNKKLKIVCAKCNNGWMSLVEERAKPLFIEMFNRASLPDESQSRIVFNNADQLTLARWAFKTAVVSHYVNGRLRFPVEHRDEFYLTGNPPQHAQIWIGAASIPDDPVRGEHLAEVKYKPVELTVRQGASASVQAAYEWQLRLLNVVFVVMGSVKDARTGIAAKISPSELLGLVITPIWPANQGDIMWPPPVSVDGIGGMAVLTQAPVIS